MNVLCAYSSDLVNKHVSDMNSLRIQIVFRKVSDIRKLRSVLADSLLNLSVGLRIVRA